MPATDELGDLLVRKVDEVAQDDDDPLSVSQPVERLLQFDQARGEVLHLVGHLERSVSALHVPVTQHGPRSVHDDGSQVRAWPVDLRPASVDDLERVLDDLLCHVRGAHQQRREAEHRHPLAGEELGQPTDTVGGRRDRGRVAVHLTHNDARALRNVAAIHT